MAVNVFEGLPLGISLFTTWWPPENLSALSPSKLAIFILCQQRKASSHPFHAMKSSLLIFNKALIASSFSIEPLTEMFLPTPHGTTEELHMLLCIRVRHVVGDGVLHVCISFISEPPYNGIFLRDDAVYLHPSTVIFLG